MADAHDGETTENGVHPSSGEHTPVVEQHVSSDRRVLALFVVAVGVLSLAIIRPYLQYVLAAIVLGYVFYPLQRRLETRFGRTTTAIGVLVVATVSVLVPVVLLLRVAIEQGLQLVELAEEGELGLAEFERRLEERGLEVDLLAVADLLREPAAIAARGVTDQAAGIVGGVPNVLIGLTILLFVLYSLLRDGDRLVAWLGMVTPLRSSVTDELFTRIDRLLYVAIVANVAVAAVQALLTTIGLALVGFPSLVFFFILTFILALLPLIGASIVWVPASVYLVGIGRPIAGAMLFVYGAVIVSLSDNLLRPIAVGRGAKMSVGTVVLGIFGGVAVAGVMGLFFGPVVLGTFKSVAELYARERTQAADGYVESNAEPSGDTDTDTE